MGDRLTVMAKEDATSLTIPITLKRERTIEAEGRSASVDIDDDDLDERRRDCHEALGSEAAQQPAQPLGPANVQAQAWIRFPPCNSCRPFSVGPFRAHPPK